MLNKLASSFVLAAALVGSTMAPSFAGDDTFKSVCQFPWRVLGCGVGAVVGVPMGIFKDSATGWSKGESTVAGKMGNEEGNFNQFAGHVVGGPIGAIGGGVYGGLYDGPMHGLKTGYSKPFSKDSVTYKAE